MEITLVDRWDNLTTDYSRYMTLDIGRGQLVDVKETDSWMLYVMDSPSGFEVYSEDESFQERYLTSDEMHEVIEFAKEQFDVEKELDSAN